MQDEDIPTIVIDIGSGVGKAGFAGDDCPRITFPSVVGKWKQHIKWNDPEEYLVGDRTQSKRGGLILKYPLKHGIVMNWDYLEKIWHYTFYSELRVNPEEYRVLLTEPPLNPKFQRERIVQIMFETFSVSALYLSNPASLSIYASGRTTGCVLESGDGCTYVVPVYENFTILHAIVRIDLGGREVTEYLMELLADGGQTIDSTASNEIVHEMKEKLAYVAVDPATENIDEKSYELPDGNVILLGRERFQCTEILFQPHWIGSSGPGIHQIIHQSIQKCDGDIQREFYANIVLSGGNTMFPGIAERLMKELVAITPSGLNVRVTASRDRKYFAWIGGSIVGSLSNRYEWITKTEYDSEGPSIIHRACFAL